MTWTTNLHGTLLRLLDKDGDCLAQARPLHPEELPDRKPGEAWCWFLMAPCRLKTPAGIAADADEAKARAEAAVKEQDKLATRVLHVMLSDVERAWSAADVARALSVSENDAERGIYCVSRLGLLKEEVGGG